jgi:4-hydroxy-tetrahydrodipicolinate synthase
VPVQTETLAELAADGTLCGVKDSGGDFGYFQRAVDATRERPDFVALQGSDTFLYAGMAYGGHGAISVRAQITPAVMVALYEAASAGDWPRARALHDHMRALGPSLGAGWIPAVKGALSALGICGPHLAAPTVGWSDEQLAAQRARLAEAQRDGLLDPLP